LTEWSIEEARKDALVRPFLSHFFAYRRKEIPEMRVFLKQRETHLAELEKAEMQLKVRKEHLWNTKQTKKWELIPGLPVTPSDLLKHKDTAFQFMLPKET
jgi:hypothetical protein